MQWPAGTSPALGIGRFHAKSGETNIEAKKRGDLVAHVRQHGLRDTLIDLHRRYAPREATGASAFPGFSGVAPDMAEFFNP